GTGVVIVLPSLRCFGMGRKMRPGQDLPGLRPRSIAYIEIPIPHLRKMGSPPHAAVLLRSLSSLSPGQDARPMFPKLYRANVEAHSNLIPMPCTGTATNNATRA